MQLLRVLMCALIAVPDCAGTMSDRFVDAPLPGATASASRWRARRAMPVCAGTMNASFIDALCPGATRLGVTVERLPR